MLLKTGMSLRTIKRIMAELQKVGVITRTGSTCGKCLDESYDI